MIGRLEAPAERARSEAVLAGLAFGADGADETEPCATCGDSGEVLREVRGLGTWEAFHPCPDCRRG